jgi:hypothetical protein
MGVEDNDKVFIDFPNVLPDWWYLFTSNESKVI